MSAEALTWAKSQQAGGPGPKGLLLLLGDMASEHGVLWAGVAYLAEKLECRKQTIIANLVKLEERGLICRFDRLRANGSRQTTVTLLAPFDEVRAPLEPFEEHEIFGKWLTRQIAERQGGTENAPSAENRTGVVQKTHPLNQHKNQTMKEREERARERKRAAETGIADVWDHFQSKHPNGARLQLDRARKQVIVKALEVAGGGKEPEELLRGVPLCKRAIDGLFLSEHHVEGNYLDISYALKGGGRSPRPDATIDRMISIAEKAESAGSSAPRATSGSTIARDEWEQMSAAQRIVARRERLMERD